MRRSSAGNGDGEEESTVAVDNRTHRAAKQRSIVTAKQKLSFKDRVEKKIREGAYATPSTSTKSIIEQLDDDTGPPLPPNMIVSEEDVTKKKGKNSNIQPEEIEDVEGPPEQYHMLIMICMKGSYVLPNIKQEMPQHMSHEKTMKSMMTSRRNKDQTTLHQPQ